LRRHGVFHDFITLVPTQSSRRRGKLSVLKLLSQEDTVQHPALTEWPLWLDDPRNDLYGHCPTERHEIALARFLEKQHVHRASAVRRLDLWAVVTRATTRLASAARPLFRARWSSGRDVGPANAVAWMDDFGLTLSKAHAVFSKTLWGR
jgi:hypothetical protein